jgi:putative peptidoglycan lipid II flippase
MSQRRVLGLGGATLVVSASILVSRLLGVLRETVLAAMLGVSTDGDVYRNAFVIPDFLNYLLAGGFLSITLIPVLARRFEAGQHREGWQDFTAVFRTIGIAIVFLTGVLMLLAEPLVRLIFPRLAAGDVATIIELTRVALPAQVFLVLGALFMAVSYTQRRFLYPALAPVIYNLGIIGGGLIGAAVDEPSPHAFVWGAVGGAVVGNFALQWFGAKRAGLQWHRGGSRQAIRQYLMLAFPLMIGQSITVLDEQFPRLFGQLTGDGGTSALSFARMLNMLPVGLIGQAAGVASFPFLARLAARGETTELADTTLKAARTAAVVGVGATASLIALADPLVRLVYQWGAFTGDDSRLVSGLLLPFSLSIPAWAIHQVIGRWFYANQLMWTPVVIGTTTTLAAIPLTLFATDRWGLPGIAGASSAVIWIYTIVLTGAWVRATERRLGLEMLKSVLRSIPGGAAAALAGLWVVRSIGGDAPFSVVPALILGAVVVISVFLLIGRVFRMPELARPRPV